MLRVKGKGVKILASLLVSILTFISSLSVINVSAMNGHSKYYNVYWPYVNDHWSSKSMHWSSYYTNQFSSNHYWPSGNWRTSTPENQGMDSKKLLEMFKAIQDEKTPIHSILIIKNGYLVTEAYFSPYNENIKHGIYSSTKSIISSLIGIAIDEGYIKGTDQKVLDFFPDVQFGEEGYLAESIKKYQVKDMTIEHLLTMSAGHTEDSSNPIFMSKYFPQTFFSLHFSSKPGTKFLYDSGATHLLSAILSKATGVTTEAYAKKHLFDPMMITDYSWDKDPNGTYLGGWGAYLKPRDMAKFGYLALKEGKWNNKQLIPEEWLKTATSKHIDGYWGDTRADDYGYLWWINPFGGFRADGYGGQYIFVLPEQDLVAVFTAGVNYSEKMQPLNCMTDFILPSIKSSRPLKADPMTNWKLQVLIKSLQYPKPQKVAVLPEIAKQISGKTYIMNSNIQTISFDFNSRNSCTLKIKQMDSEHRLKAGLDDIYRISEATKVGGFTLYPNYTKVALKGNWVNDNTFEIDWSYFGEPYRGIYKFTFNDSNVLLEINEYLEDSSYMTSSYKVINGKIE
jgi:CubicO group peptidase (beta-lactamase class C family)